MTVMVRSRVDLTLENFRRVAWDHETVELSEGCWDTIDASREAFLRYVDENRDQPIYGVTTGFGDLAKQVLSAGGRRQQAQWRGHHTAVGVGLPYPTRVVRGIMFARLANFVDGHSGVSSALVRDVLSMLDKDEVPSVRARGQMASGEVNTLLELFAALLGERRGLKEANALTNGSPCSAAFVSDAALRAANLLTLIDKVMALVIVAGRGPLAPYDRFLGELWTDETEKRALQRLGQLLESQPDVARYEFQPPVSWRIIPRVLGATYRAVDTLCSVAQLSLSSNTDNPVFIGGSNAVGEGLRVLPTGGFHNAQACPALDGSARAWADLATLTGRFLAVLGRDMLSFERELSLYGLTGFHAYFAREARQAAAPTVILAEDTFSSQSDVMLPTPYAYKKETGSVGALVACLAATAAAASQTLWYHEVQLTGELGELLEEIRECSVPGDVLRSQGDEMMLLMDVFDKQIVVSR